MTMCIALQQLCYLQPGTDKHCCTLMYNLWPLVDARKNTFCNFVILNLLALAMVHFIVAAGEVSAISVTG